MKKFIIFGVALAVLFAVAPAMAGEFGAFKDMATASLKPMTDSELGAVEGEGLLDLFFGANAYASASVLNIVYGSQSNVAILAIGSQSNTAVITQIGTANATAIAIN